ncbi:hypothetical protein CMI37_18775 [Candidatus Pacearchaeota archaeon]|nr:hypothetical protein [Candidatus Pacearchaeota archaeon]
MGYLDNSSVTVDAVLTKKGRELLARGQNEFKITHFALADDEVDYDLYNTDHPLGTAYYGAAIESMPVMEALPDETQALKYKLMTMPKGLSNLGRVPVVQIANTSGQTHDASTPIGILPTTLNFQNANNTLGYTAVLSDSDVASLVATQGVTGQPTVPAFIGDNEAAQSVTVQGFAFQVVGKQNTQSEKQASITIIGNETGGQVTFSFTIRKWDGTT